MSFLQEKDDKRGSPRPITLDDYIMVTVTEFSQELLSCDSANDRLGCRIL
jgi:hypothetical protein